MELAAAAKTAKPPALVLGTASLAAGGGVLGAAFYLTRDPRVVLILLVGMAIVILLLVLYALVLRLLKRRKQMPFLRSLMGNTTAAPNAITSPEARARIDALARTFQGGIQKFRSAGKDLYSLPWYLLVGEPGSGKTEAIRHCNVGFPPGLQDKLQGSGGTLNMHWWFTNQAVILDTAGRLLFDEVEPGTTGEWDEFLQMLAGHRPNCPINGLLLVIPSESVIKDSPEMISTKGGKIAQQLDHIQRTLGVRFPVFVIVTKCDKINGFRYFFENLRELAPQQQILGWANPDPLDKPFNPELVDAHLREISQRLFRRRLGLLLDPVSEEPSERRIDQMDTLYVFPDSFLQIAPRLRQYLETIFTPGEWSPKPLFLRGIFFTSSLREGSAMDVELAQMLGISVESLPEGKAWERERSYFLRDLFVNKVFRERALVTRANNTKQLQRRRKIAMMGTAFISVIVLLFVTWFGNDQLRRSLGDESDYWGRLQAQQPVKNLSVVQRFGNDFRYQGEEQAALGPDGQNESLIDFYSGMRGRMNQKIDVFWIFRPMAAIGRLNDQRLEALASMYTGYILSPVVKGAESKMQREGADDWSDSATQALAELVHSEVTAGDGVPPRISPLLAYVVAPATQPSGHALQVLDDAGDAVSGKSEGSSAITAFLTDHSRTMALDAAVERFTAHWDFELSTRNPRLYEVMKMKDDLTAFDQQRTTMQSLGQQIEQVPPSDVPTYLDSYSHWQKYIGSMRQIEKSLEDDANKLESDGGWRRDEPLAQFYSEEVKKQQTAGMQAYQLLLSKIPDGTGGALASCRSNLQTGLDELSELKSSLDAQASALDTWDRSLMASVSSEEIFVPKYQAVVELYNQVDASMPDLSKDPPPVTESDWISFVSEVNKSLGQMNGAVEQNDRLELRDPTLKLDADNCNNLFAKMAQPARLYLLIKSALATAQLKDQIEDLVQQLQHNRSEDSHYQAMKLPEIPLTSGNPRPAEDTRYNPAAAADLMRGWELIQTLLNPSDSTGATTQPDVLAATVLSASDDYTQKQKQLQAYAADYVNVWTLRPTWLDVRSQTWDSLISNLPDPAGTNQALNTLGTKCQQALAASWLKQLEDQGDDEFRDALETARNLALATVNATQPGVPQGLCDRSSQMIQSWTDLSVAGSIEARRRILDMTSSSFVDYVGTLSGEADPATQYWQNVVTRILDSLANESQLQRDKAMQTLHDSYEVFPLVPFSPDVGILKQEDVEKVGELLDQIGVDSAQGGADNVAKPIREGARIAGDSSAARKINESLDRLRGIALNKSQETWLAEMRQAIKSLESQAPVSISLLPDIEQQKLRVEFSGNRGVASNKWSQVQLAQGQRVIGDKQVIPVRGIAPVALGNVDCAGDPVKFFFWSFYQGGAPDEPLSDKQHASNWDCLRLVETPNAQMLNGGKQYDVELVLDDGAQQYSFWVQIDFGDIPFIPPKDWPN